MKADQVNVRYMVEDVDTLVDFYTKYLGFKLGTNSAPAFADVTRGNLRLLLSGKKSSAGRAMPDGAVPIPGGWNRIELVVDDLSSEIEKLKSKGFHFRNDIVTGPAALRFYSLTLLEILSSYLNRSIKEVLFRSETKTCGRFGATIAQF